MTCAWNLAFSHNAHATPRHPPPPNRTSTEHVPNESDVAGPNVVNLFFSLRLARVKSIIVFDIISTKSSSSVSFLPCCSFTSG